jgi:hypothetical protein
VVGLEVKEIEQRREEVGVLARIHENGVSTLAPDFMDEGGHFDHLWAGAKAEENAGG